MRAVRGLEEHELAVGHLLLCVAGERFLVGAVVGAAVVATAACEVLSVFSAASAEPSRLCTQCNSFCVTSCTTSTCVNQGPPPPPPPTCVQGFK